ncbi:MAG: hypothetical protein HY698_01360, partial [Deltaproteobacteria bacterium]|nr:hypothetical protein [Deltaproteobacteria bacterium]
MRTLLGALGVLFGLGSCATSTAPGDCDPQDERCSCVGDARCTVDPTTRSPDASVDAHADARPFADAAGHDARPLREFGEPCDDKKECKSKICVLVGTSGMCTMECIARDCPEGFGCYKALGAMEPGELADVCVPKSTQLCTPCTAPTECSLASADLCISFPTGGSFCGRDCSVIGCPDGYSCQDMTFNGRGYRQCIPQSGACDCNASLVDERKPCTITTPLATTCPGMRTCLGQAGWSACQPLSPVDEPDAAFTDDNCDGIDGDVTVGVFVSKSNGFDLPSCGATFDSPCATIGTGNDRATQLGRKHVYVQAEDYQEVVVLRNGIHVFGGYDGNWQRGAHSDPSHRVQVLGGLDSMDGEYMTVRAHDVAELTRIADLVLVGPNATGAMGTSGRGSYVVHASRASVRLERVTMIAGNGAEGSGGERGMDAPVPEATPEMGGKKGGNADSYSQACDDSGHGEGGAGGWNPWCSTGTDSRPGRGGDGGRMDTSCSVGCLFGNCDASSGQWGGNAAQLIENGPGRGGEGGSGGSTCGNPGSGISGRVSNGVGGNGGKAGGFLSKGYWYAYPGDLGGVGDNGGGGGGGGGSGGCDKTNPDSYGAGGGGGGSGGCAALSGGGRGHGGGGSFAVFAIDSTVTVTECAVTRGKGGDGGDGGEGGRG